MIHILVFAGNSLLRRRRGPIIEAPLGLGHLRARHLGGQYRCFGLALLEAARLGEDLPYIGRNVMPSIASVAVGALAHLELGFWQTVSGGTFQQGRSPALVLGNIGSGKKGVRQLEFRS